LPVSFPTSARIVLASGGSEPPVYQIPPSVYFYSRSDPEQRLRSLGEPSHSMR
jgi:hypothetical protein